MKQFINLLVVGILSGLLLASLLVLVYLATGNKVYILLFNVDYIPFLRSLWSQPGIGIVFHFVFTVSSVLGLYYMLSIFHFEKKIPLYITIYTFGSAILFFLTALSEQQPAAGDIIAWFYWTCAHAVFSIAVGFSVKRWG